MVILLIIKRILPVALDHFTAELEAEVDVGMFWLSGQSTARTGTTGVGTNGVTTNFMALYNGNVLALGAKHCTILRSCCSTLK